MKKLMMAVAAVAFAAGVQAASINWQSSSIFVDADGNMQTAATAPAGTFVLCYLGNTTDGYSFDDATVVNEGSVSYGSSKGATAKASGSYNFTYAETGGVVNNGDVFAVMFKDSDGKLFQLETVDGDPIENTFTVTGMGYNTYAGSFEFASENYTVAVPEPTSGLLLLLGMAGLALRRKQK